MGGSACCAGARPIGQKTHAGAGRPGRRNDANRNQIEGLLSRRLQFKKQREAGIRLRLHLELVEEKEGSELTESQYLEEEWTLVLGLRAGGPEPVRQWSGLGCGHEVAQCHWLL